MLQVRKLVLAVAAATAFSSSFTHALGLGDLAVKLSLNQPLEAEISLLEVRDLSAIEIKSQLASPEDFSKAGIDRQFFLTGLKFSSVVGANGKPYIRVTSSKPVKEPYLNFLVEVLWPNGRLLREYTLLLDPPLYQPQQVIYAAQPATTAAPLRAVAPQQVRQPQPVARASAPASTTLQGSDYRVQKNDTLWEIARRTGGNASVHQTMLAIQDLNPNAFIDGNINRMKSGQVLRLPTEQDILGRTRADAIAQVKQQNTNWRTERTTPAAAERQLDATHRSTADAAPAEIEETDNLRLVADTPGQAGQAGDQGSAVDVQSLQNQLASSKERLDSTILENEDLSGSVEELTSQLDKLKRLLELKDNQLAQLQSSIGVPSEPAVVAMPDDKLDTDGLAVVADANTEDLEQVDSSVVDSAQTSEAQEQEPAVTEAEVELESDVDVVAEAEIEAAEAVEAVEAEIEAAEAVEVLESEPAEIAAQPQPQPQPQANAAEDKSIVDTLKNEPMLLAVAGAGAVLGLLLLLMAISRSKARKEADQYAEQLNETLTPDDTQAETPGVDVLGASSIAAGQEVDDFDQSFAFDHPVADAQFKQEITDPLVEATSYISFGRFNQASDVLYSAIEKEPERVDLRFKLLEVCADLEDQIGFSRQVTEIGEIGGADAELEQIKARYPQMLGAEQVASVADDFNLDDIGFDSSTAFGSTPAMQLDAELDDLSALLADSDPVAAEDKDSLGVDIDSFSFDLDPMEQTQKAPADDEFFLDDLALELADTEVAETPRFDLSDGFTLAEQDKSEATEFDFKLDEESVGLESLSANFDDDSFANNTLTDAELSDFDLDDLGDLADFDPKPTVEPQAATLASVGEADLQLNDLEDLGDIEDDFSFLSGTDETATKLDLARAYIDMGDAEGARDILDEVVIEGTAVQQDEARELISQLG